MDVKMNLRIITKNHADDSKIGFPLKIDFKAEWTHESMPTAWELKIINSYNNNTFKTFSTSLVLRSKLKFLAELVIKSIKFSFVN